MDEWEDKKTGEKRRKTKIIVDNLQMLGGKREEQPDHGQDRGEYRQRPERSNLKPRPPVDPDLEPEEDDIPF